MSDITLHDIIGYPLAFIGMNTVLTLSTFHFMRLDGKLESVSVRLPGFVAVCAFANGICLNFFILDFFPSIYGHFPCFVGLWFFYLAVPLWLYGNLLREMQILFLHYLNMARLQKYGSASGASDSKGGNIFAGMNLFDWLVFGLIRWLLWMVKPARRAENAPKFESVMSKGGKSNIIGSVTLNGTPMDSSSGIDSITDSTNNNNAGPKRSTKTNLNNELANMTSFNVRDLARIVAGIVALQAIILVIVSFAYPGFGLVPLDMPPCYNSAIFNPLFLTVAIYMLTKACTLFSLRKIQDTHGFRLEVNLSFTFFMLLFPPYYLRLPAPGHWSFYGLVLSSILHFFMVIFPIYYGRWDRRHVRKGLLAYDLVSFEEAMNNPTSYAQLKVIMAETFCMENIIFYEEVVTFKARQLKNRGKGDTVSIKEVEEVQRELQRLFDRFICPSSPFELNLNDKVRNDFTEVVKNSKSIIEKNGTLHNNSIEALMTPINRTLKDVETLIFTNSFPRLLRLKAKEKSAGK